MYQLNARKHRKPSEEIDDRGEITLPRAILMCLLQYIIIYMHITINAKQCNRKPAPQSDFTVPAGLRLPTENND